MRYAFDTEFIEDGKTIDLLSIGIVAEDGREYYAQSLDCDLAKANPWVRKNVISHLDRLDALDVRNPFWTEASRLGLTPWRRRDLMRAEIHNFVDPPRYGPPEFWTYYGDYDWVALCQLFGTMMDLPKGWPMLAYDLRQLLDMQGRHYLTQPDDAPHHALSDAKWIMETLTLVSDGDLVLEKDSA